MAFIKEMKFRISSVIDNLGASGLPDGDPERTEISVDGFYKIDGDNYEITYSEMTDGGKVVSTITVSSGEVRVIRRGAVDSEMVFIEGESHSSVYTVSPYSFDTVVTCRKVRMGLDKDGGRLDIFYGMNIGGADKSVRMRIDCAYPEGK
jgi:uncharacterized beta-barrel protein YwiB (DUF1934 family)